MGQHQQEQKRGLGAFLGPGRSAQEDKGGWSLIKVASPPRRVRFLFSPAVGPILQAKPEPVSVDVGEDASFSCAWRGNPLPRVTWTRRGGVQVKAGLGPGWLTTGFIPKSEP